MHSETLIKRQVTRHDCLPSLLSDGDKSTVKKWPVRKKIFCTGQGRTKISCTGTTSPANQPRKDPCQMYSLSPHIIGLQIRYDPPLSLSIWMHPSLNIKKTLTLDGWASNISYLQYPHVKVSGLSKNTTKTGLNIFNLNFKVYIHTTCVLHTGLYLVELPSFRVMIFFLPEPGFRFFTGQDGRFLAWPKTPLNVASDIPSCSLILFRGTLAFQSSTATRLSSIEKFGTALEGGFLLESMVPLVLI